MQNDFRALARRLSQHAEAVCVRYLSNGSKNGRYWLVGDVHNTSGRSLYVRLVGPEFGAGAAGQWTDAATGQHGDLIDLIRLNRGVTSLAALRDEVLAFLSEPRAIVANPASSAPRNRSRAARQLFAEAQPLQGTLGETYLRSRAISCALPIPSLRFHPRCHCHDRETLSRQTLPAIIAGITAGDGSLTGVLRLYLDAASGNAPVSSLSRAMGDVLGHAIRFGSAGDVLAAGKGIETMLALQTLAPRLPVNAAMSSSHLAALVWPANVRRLYIAIDNDASGSRATEKLVRRARGTDVEVHLLKPMCEDWNTDLMTLGFAGARARLAPQLAPADNAVLGG